MAVDVPLRRLFDYRCPPAIDAARLRPGQRLWVPFGRQRVAAVLVEHPTRSAVPEAKLRSASALIDETPVLDPSLLELLLSENRADRIKSDQARYREYIK